MRNKYWVLYNYVRAEKLFNCNETITYTTHGDFSFLDNLEPLLARWRGPVSVAVYAPGSDLDDTIDAILYFRDCGDTDLVRSYATFHVFFDLDHIPANVPRHDTLLKKVCIGYYTSTSKDSCRHYYEQTNMVFPLDIATLVRAQP